MRAEKVALMYTPRTQSVRNSRIYDAGGAFASLRLRNHYGDVSARAHEVLYAHVTHVVRAPLSWHPVTPHPQGVEEAITGIGEFANADPRNVAERSKKWRKGS